MKRAEEEGCAEFEQFFSLYEEEVERTAEALAEFKNRVYKWQARVWPEMVTTPVSYTHLDVYKRQIL